MFTLLPLGQHQISLNQVLYFHIALVATGYAILIFMVCIVK
jgi:hypothetical protein